MKTKHLLFCSISLLGLFVVLSSFSTKSDPNDCGETPELNQQIINYVDTKIKKKVGRGECWDLAANALNLVRAKWDGKYKFGEVVNPKSDCIYPGDIIQFKGVKYKFVKDGYKNVGEMKHHTAIVYKVNGKGNYILAHQNTAESGRKVGLTTFDLKDVYKGKMTFYRPVK